MGIIKVLGQADVKFVPDVIRITINVDKLYSKYQQAFEAGADNTNIIKDILTNCNLDRDLAKTTRFAINKHSEYEKVDKYNSQYVFKGYKIKQTFEIDLEISSPTLTPLLDAIGNSLKGVEIEIGFAVSNVEEARLKMIEVAVKDALKKAEVMASATNKQLGDIKSINYGVSKGEYYETGECYEPTSTISSAPMDITPAELNGYTTVEVVIDLL